MPLLLTGLAVASEPPAIFEDLKKEKYETAVPDLQAMKKDSKDYLWSLSESAKVYYKTSRWSEFFGVAYYSRKALPPSVATDHIRLLEVLALLRHCQSEQAKQVMTFRPYPTDAALRKHYLVLAELLQIPPELAGKNAQPGDNTAKKKGLFSDSNMWPVQQLQMEKLDPHRLRRKVEALCDKKEAK